MSGNERSGKSEEDGTPPPPLTAEMLSKILHESIMAAILPIQKRLDTLETWPNSENKLEELKKEKQAAERKLDLRRQRLLHQQAIEELEAEIMEIESTTWTPPAGGLIPKLDAPLQSRNNSQTRFRSDGLPKFRFGNNLDSWLDGDGPCHQVMGRTNGLPSHTIELFR